MVSILTIVCAPCVQSRLVRRLTRLLCNAVGAVIFVFIRDVLWPHTAILASQAQARHRPDHHRRDTARTAPVINIVSWRSQGQLGHVGVAMHCTNLGQLLSQCLWVCLQDDCHWWSVSALPLLGHAKLGVQLLWERSVRSIPQLCLGKPWCWDLQLWKDCVLCTGQPHTRRPML